MSTLSDISRAAGRGAAQAKLTKPGDFTLTEEIPGQGTVFCGVPAGEDVPGGGYRTAVANPEDECGVTAGTDVLSGTDPYLIDDAPGLLFAGDNLRVMKSLLEKGCGGKFRLIYIDPPFFTGYAHEANISAGGLNVRKTAYRDRWKKGLYEYIRELTSRLILMRELLARDGLIFVHLDWHAVHYVQIIMDELFGENRFVNEIIWTYKSGGSGSRHFSRKHDNILVYSKSPKYHFNPQKEKSYNRGLKPYRFKGVEEYRDETGWYTLVNMKDVWQIDMVGRTSRERTGYATQKPEKLLERIVLSASDEGDLCGDFFCGSGTLPAVASRLGRRFVACDTEPLAVEGTIGRLALQGSACRVYRPEPLTVSDTGESVPSFDVDFRTEERETRSPDRTLIRIYLTAVREMRPGKDTDSGSREKIEKLEREDPAGLIYSLSVDTDFNGSVFRPVKMFVRRNGELPVHFETAAPKDSVILIKAADILGRTVYKKVRA